MTYEQAIEMVASLKNSGKTPEETVEILVKDSIEKGSMDNVTAIVIFLNPPRSDLFFIFSTDRPPKEEKKEEEGEEGDVMDVWEFLKTECERKEKEKVIINFLEVSNELGNKQNEFETKNIQSSS